MQNPSKLPSSLLICCLWLHLAFRSRTLSLDLYKLKECADTILHLRTLLLYLLFLPFSMLHL